MPSGGQRKIAVVLHVHETQAWGDYVRQDIERAFAERPDVAVAMELPEDAREQLELLTRYLDRRVDGLILAPIAPLQTKDLLRKYRAAQIPVVLADSDVGDPALCDAVVLADHRYIGRLAAKFFVEAMDGRGELIELQGHASSAVTGLRSEGFREVIAAYPKIRIIDTCTGDWLYGCAKSAFVEVLARQKKIDGVFAHNDDMARGAVDAAREAGRSEEMLISGVDAIPGERGTIRLVTQGILAATFLNPSPGREAVHALLAIMDGEPFQKETLLKTSPLRSSERLRAWQLWKRQGRH